MIRRFFNITYIEARDLLVFYNKCHRDYISQIVMIILTHLGLAIEIAMDILNSVIPADEACNKFLHSKSKD
jgi:hypothetical protein